MKTRLLLAACCACLAIAPTLSVAQEAAAADTLEALEPIDISFEPEMTYDDYFVKAYTISIFGGHFEGDEFLNLPVRGVRSFVEEGSDRVVLFNGEDLEYEFLELDGPVKELEPGLSLGVKVGTWLSDEVHVDLSLAYTTTEAVLTMVDRRDAENLVRRELDDRDGVTTGSRDPDVSIYRAGLGLTYELAQYELFGIHPYVGFGFGGIITRFTALDDTGELYFNGTLGLERPLFGSAALFAQFDMTTFAMSREELQYSERVTFLDARVGLTWFVDVLPAEIRALHEADKAAKPASRH